MQSIFARNVDYKAKNWQGLWEGLFKKEILFLVQKTKPPVDENGIT